MEIHNGREGTVEERPRGLVNALYLLGAASISSFNLRHVTIKKGIKHHYFCYFLNLYCQIKTGSRDFLATTLHASIAVTVKI